MSNFTKIRPVGAELFMRMEKRTDGRTDGQTDRQDEAHNRFSQFCQSVRTNTLCYKVSFFNVFLPCIRASFIKKNQQMSL
jgi:hypothetical protein